ncbi:MAG: RNA polymerase sigma factor [Desulfobacteraceae bacterium]|nr:MAG: RNA polymerase sigma factor [Desulfobacteraceae bacterium]
MTTEKGGPDFESLLRPHFAYLYRISYRFAGNRADAEDLVQELLIKLYARRKELSKVSNLRPWLVRVLYRLFLDSERKQKCSPLRLVKGGHQANGEDPLDQIPGSEPDPEQHTQRRNLAQHIEQALNQLGKDQRAVLTLHDIEGYRLGELETLLEVPLGTLKSRLHRARASLREILEKKGNLLNDFFVLNDIAPEHEQGELYGNGLPDRSKLY